MQHELLRGDYAGVTSFQDVKHQALPLNIQGSFYLRRANSMPHLSCLRDYALLISCHALESNTQREKRFPALEKE
jgi:hypothetical protein